MWNADMIAGVLAAILNSEDEGHTEEGKEAVWVEELPDNSRTTFTLLDFCLEAK